MYNCLQFKEIIEHVLKIYDRGKGLYSPAAVNLLLGTAAQESKFGTYLRQIKGPALGPFQMEPATFRWLKDKYKKIFFLYGAEAEDLVYDLRCSVLFCRLRYYAVPEPLPVSEDLQGLAQYWKKHYNTPIGKGTVEEFIRNYKKYVR